MKLTLRKSDVIDDCYIIERHEEPGEHHEWDEPAEYGSHAMKSAWLSNAEVGGSAAEMLAIAGAIRARSDLRFRRCAVVFVDHFALFYSPRNTRTDPDRVPLADADALADLIVATLGVPRRAP